MEEDEVCESCEKGCKVGDDYCWSLEGVVRFWWWYFGGRAVRCLRHVFGVGCGMSAICLRENNNKTFYMLVLRLFPRFWW